MGAIIGVNSKGEIDGVPVHCDKWSVETKVNNTDVTTMLSGGFLEMAPTFIESDISIEGRFEDNGELGTVGLYDIYNPTLSAAARFYVPVALWPYKGNANEIYEWDDVLIEQFNVSSDVKNVVRFTFKGKGYSQPTNVPSGATGGGTPSVVAG